jgi:hypothetical protein
VITDLNTLALLERIEARVVAAQLLASARDGQEERFEELAGRHEQVMRQVEATRAMIQASRVSL